MRLGEGAHSGTVMPDGCGGMDKLLGGKAAKELRAEEC